MEKYLTEDLSVPSNGIQLLLRCKKHASPNDLMYPSHAHIIGALLNLITNPEIVHNIIIIYYARHGSHYPLTEDGKDDETEYIEALCPINYNTPGDNGKHVPDISNYIFNTILTLISLSKGHQITVILDCCHSGGVS
ncbi:hypothetical protein ARMGADRAFT_925773 [Armillaria gallica]|uniref:Peptidase C14 n=1 Tax=Armillaria gallica TaxID=47427 RepID=A0A2H3DW12_ARMGA|nr:hypothetical protein ARMGADRAFT_925773 [Armillaria gallica]